MTWTTRTPEDKREAVRALVQHKGATYGEAALALGTTRTAIAGVVDRSSKSPGGKIVSNSSIGRNEDKKRRAPKKYAPKAEKPKKPKKQKHAGFHRFVALPNLPLPVEPVTREDAWLALPGSTPVAIEHHTTGCRFPVGEISPFAFCNLPVKDGPYCARHSALCYREPPIVKPRKETAQ